MASTYLSRSQSSSNQQIFTISTWVKRADFPANSYITNIASDGNNRFGIIWQAGTLSIYSLTAGIQDIFLNTSAQFRDVSAWYHIVLKIDTTQATASDRAKLYVNGTQITSFASADYPTQNLNFPTNNTHYIGCFLASNQSFNFSGSMSHYHYTDGYAYDASTFGEFDAQNVWKPKTAPSVTYGTNGFFLKFANAGSLGTDSSGNGNNLTVNGTGTQTLDTPSNVFATLNALLQSGVGTFTNGNLTHSSSSGIKHTVSTLGMTTGKWYAEAKYTGGANYNGVGFATEPIFPTTSAWYSSPYNATLTYTNVYNNGSSYGSFAVPNTGDIIGMAIDLDNGYMYWSNNGVWGNSGVPTSGPTGTGGIATSLIGTLGSSTFFFATEQDATPGTRTAEWNFGNGYFGTTAVSTPNADGDGYGKFEYSVPTGYYALCTKNIQTYG